MRTLSSLLLLAGWLATAPLLAQKGTPPTTQAAPNCAECDGNQGYICIDYGNQLPEAIHWINCRPNGGTIVVRQNLTIATPMNLTIKKPVRIVSLSKCSTGALTHKKIEVVSGLLQSGFQIVYSTDVCGPGGGAPPSGNRMAVRQKTDAVEPPSEPPASCCYMPNTAVMGDGVFIEDVELTGFQPYALSIQDQKEVLIDHCILGSAVQLKNLSDAVVTGCAFNLAALPADLEGTNPAYNGSGIEMERIEYATVANNTFTTTLLSPFRNFRCGDIAIKANAVRYFSAEANIIGDGFATATRDNVANRFEVGIQAFNCQSATIIANTITSCYTGVAIRSVTQAEIGKDQQIGANAPISAEENCIPVLPQAGIWVGPNCPKTLIYGNNIRRNAGSGICITDPELDKRCAHLGPQLAYTTQTVCTGAAANPKVVITNNTVGGANRSQPENGNLGYGILVTASDSAFVHIGEYTDDEKSITYQGNTIGWNGKEGVAVLQHKNVRIDVNAIFKNQQLAGVAEEQKKPILLGAMPCQPFLPVKVPGSCPVGHVGRLGNEGLSRILMNQIPVTSPPTCPGYGGGAAGPGSPVTTSIFRISDLEFRVRVNNLPASHEAHVYLGDGRGNLDKFAGKLVAGATNELIATLDNPDQHFVGITYHNNLPYAASGHGRNTHSTSEVDVIDLSATCNFVSLRMTDAELCTGDVGEVLAAKHGPGGWNSEESAWYMSPPPPLSGPFYTEASRSDTRLTFLATGISPLPNPYVAYTYPSGCEMEGGTAASPCTTKVFYTAFSPPNATVSVVPVSCSSKDDGQITIHLISTGGTTGTAATYTLVKRLAGEPIAQVSIPLQAGGNVISNIETGIYDLVLQNSPNGCISKFEVTVPVNKPTVTLGATGFASCATNLSHAGPTPGIQIPIHVSYTYYSTYTYTSPKMKVGLFKKDGTPLASFEQNIQTSPMVNGMVTTSFTHTFDFPLPFAPDFDIRIEMWQKNCPNPGCVTFSKFCNPTNIELPYYLYPFTISTPAKPSLTIVANPGETSPVVYKCDPGQPVKLEVHAALEVKADPLNLNHDKEQGRLELLGPGSAILATDPVVFTQEPLSGFVKLKFDQSQVVFTSGTPEGLPAGLYKVRFTFLSWGCVAEQALEIKDLAPIIHFETKPEMCYGTEADELPSQVSRITAFVENEPPFPYKVKWYKYPGNSSTGTPEAYPSATEQAEGPTLEGIVSGWYAARIEFDTPPVGVPCTAFTHQAVELHRVTMPCSPTATPAGTGIHQLHTTMTNGLPAAVTAPASNPIVCGLYVHLQDNTPRYNVAPRYKVYWYKRNCETKDGIVQPPTASACSCNVGGTPAACENTIPVSGLFKGPKNLGCTGQGHELPKYNGADGTNDCLIRVSVPVVTGDDNRTITDKFTWEHLEDKAVYYAVVYDEVSMCHTLLEMGVNEHYIKPRIARTYNLCMRWGFPTPPPAAPAINMSLVSSLAPSDIMEPIKDFAAACAGRKSSSQAALALEFNRNPLLVKDDLTITYTEPKGQYTLYEYDRAGNLTKTVPPKGVNANGPHSMATTYAYNALGQVVSQTTPDGGTTNMRYDMKGMLRYSQNAKQASQGLFSYTNYDALKRIVEVGEGQGDYVAADLNNDYGGTKTEWVSTIYTDPYEISGVDLKYFHQTGKPQQHLSNRVSYTTTHTGMVTAYSYDPHGNVEWVFQQLAYNQGPNTLPPHETDNTDHQRQHWIRYEYDLISGKVLRVALNEYRPDRFFHRYSYDEDNRLTMAETSRDGLAWEADARYEYYPHGPLRRTTLGASRVQAVDYTYTLQGWLKHINAPGTERDGDQPDQFSSQLDYFGGDYASEGIASPGSFADPTHELYNGNIMAWHTQTGTAPAMQQSFGYDLLNRLVVARADGGAIHFDQTVDTGPFGSHYSYDANGNLMGLQRNTVAAAGPGAGVLMDKLLYEYGPGTNRLTSLQETALNPVLSDPNLKLNDIKHQTAPYTYGYDDIGNLTQDAEGQAIAWTAFGKVASVTGPTLKDATGAIASITFAYDAAGNRAMKQVVYTNQPAKDYTEWTIRDAGGNAMATYRETYNPQGTNAIAHTTPHEVYIYGSDRLGVYTPEAVELSWALAPALPTSGSLAVGHKAYELKDHLGNVRAVVGDNGQLQTSTDYYPLGMAMATGSQGNGRYRYGFNGKEKDDEVKGAGNSLDFGARIYDARIGRWLSLDPLQLQFPSSSPYNGFDNNPICFDDPSGEAARFSVSKGTISVSTVIHIYGPGASKGKAKEMQDAIMAKWKGGTFKGKDGKTYNIKFDVKVVNHPGKLTDVVQDVKPGDNVASIKNDPDGKHRSNVSLGFYGNFSSGDVKAVPHEFGHFMGLADKYYDAATKKIEASKDKDGNYQYEIEGRNLDGVQPGDIMGKDASSPNATVTKSELSAIGNEILSQGKDKGVMINPTMNLDKPDALPEPPPIDISPDQKLHGYE